MKDPFDLFIDDSVFMVQNDYYELMYQTKQVFFESLKNKVNTIDFSSRVSKIWEKVDYSFMEQRMRELEDMIKQRDLTGRPIINENAEYEQIYDIIKNNQYKTVEDKFKKIIEVYYKQKLIIVNKGYIDVDSYLSELVNKYDKIEQTIPYYNKDGTVHSYHTVASYNSMLFNVSLNHTGWNRTAYDAKLLGINIEYLPAHTLACPLCQPWQGKLYSNDGTYGEIDSIRYQPKQVAIEGGVGHPNCKHQWLLYWDKSQIQENDYNSEEWIEKYKQQQKNRAIERKIRTFENDIKIYKKLNNQEKVDGTLQKIQKLKSKLNG